MKNFYEILYRSKREELEGNPDYLNGLQMPKLSDVEKQSLDEAPVIEEINEAVKALKSGKFLLKLKRKILEDGVMHLSARRGIITLLEKQDEKNQIYLANWHPLSLPNVDYKILSKLLAARLNTVLPRIINLMQSGFMENRNIAANILTLTNTIDYCDKNDVSAVIMSNDFHKTFDSLEWDSIRTVFSYLNFGEFSSRQLKRCTEIPLVAS